MTLVLESLSISAGTDKNAKVKNERFYERRQTKLEHRFGHGLQYRPRFNCHRSTTRKSSCEIDKQNQYSHRESMRIFGYFRLTSENTNEIMKKLVADINVTVSMHDTNVHLVHYDVITYRSPAGAMHCAFCTHQTFVVPPLSHVK